MRIFSNFYVSLYLTNGVFILKCLGAEFELFLILARVIDLKSFDVVYYYFADGLMYEYFILGNLEVGNSLGSSSSDFKPP